MTYEPDDIAHVRLPLTSLVLLVALPAALVPVMQSLSVAGTGNGASAVGAASASLSFAGQPGAVVAGSIIGLLFAYIIGGRKSMFLAVLTIVVAVAAMLAIGSPQTFGWGRATLNLAAGALLILPILVLGHYGSHRQIAAGMPGLILGPFIVVALIGMLTRPEAEGRIAALTDNFGLGAVAPMAWLAIILTVLLVLSLFRAMGRARGGRPNALFSAELRADARAALGFILTGPQIYALLVAMALTGYTATAYLGDFARRSPLEGFGLEPNVAAAICLGLGGFIIARLFGPRRHQHVLATTFLFLLITTGLMAGTDIMFAPSATSTDVFVWPYTQGQLILLVLTCAAMAMLGASFTMIWLAIVDVGLGVLATILLVTVLVARFAAPAVVPRLPLPEMWLATGLLGTALVLVMLGTLFGRRPANVAAPVQPDEFTAFEPEQQDRTAEPSAYSDEPAQGAYARDDEPEFNEATKLDPEPAFDSKPEFDDRREPDDAPSRQDPPAVDPAPREAQDRPRVSPQPEVRQTIADAPDVEARPDSSPDRSAERVDERPAERPAGEKPAGRRRQKAPWLRKRRRRDTAQGAMQDASPGAAPEHDATAPREPVMRDTPPEPPARPAARPREPEAAPAAPARREQASRHEAVHDTHIDWAKLGATVERDETAPPNTPPPTDAPDRDTRRRGARPDDTVPAPPAPRTPPPEAQRPQTRQTEAPRASAPRSEAPRPAAPKPAAPKPAAPRPAAKEPENRDDTPARPAPAKPAARPQPAEPAFTRHESTAFDFDRLRENTRGTDETKDQTDEEKD
ncbi:MAG: hypothetical protein ABJ215_14240 [Alphaproteobacteria bacterium]